MRLCQCIEIRRHSVLIKDYTVFPGKYQNYLLFCTMDRVKEWDPNVIELSKKYVMGYLDDEVK